jgi:YkoY family integral membrane protein
MELLAAAEFFGQRVEASDIAVVLLLIVLEGVLSIDNALVLGLLAKRLPKHQQKRALTYGLVGAFVFRLIAIFTATILIKLPIMKLLGGGYLIYVAVKHFFFDEKHHDVDHIRIGPDGHPMLDDPAQPGETDDLPPEQREREIAERSPVVLNSQKSARALAAFWPTVIVIELTDIAFAIDSILAALAFIPPSPVIPNPKLWVVITGGMLGVVLMRFAAVIFIRLLERFPRFETSAYLLVIVIGLKLCLDWYFNRRPEGWPIDKAWHGPLDFHSVSSPAFWTFWALMAICFAIGFIPKRGSKYAGIAPPAEPAPAPAPPEADAAERARAHQS